MNLREISEHELESTLINLEKIFQEHENSIYSGDLSGKTVEELAEKAKKAGYKFYSAFENGGEIGTVGTVGNEIVVMAVKKYAKGRGVGRELIERVVADYPPGAKLKVDAVEEAVSFYSHMGFNPDDPSNPVVVKNGLKCIPMHRIIV